MCSELCKDFYVVYQLEMVAGEVESSCQLVATLFFFFFGLTLPNYRDKSGSAQPPSYQLLAPPLGMSVYQYGGSSQCIACELKSHVLWTMSDVVKIVTYRVTMIYTCIHLSSVCDAFVTVLVVQFVDN